MNNSVCGCRQTPEGREICALHLALFDKQGNIVDLRKKAEGPHLGGELEKLKQRKDKR